MLAEQDRLAYLQALGITQYVERSLEAELEPLSAEYLTDSFAEPGAADTQAEATKSKASAAAEVHRLQMAAKLNQSSSSAVTSLASKPKHEPNHETQVSEETHTKAAPSEQVAPFTLQVIAIGHWRLAMELVAADAPGLSNREIRLLSDLLLAMGLDAEDQTSKWFRWPLMNHPGISLDIGSAREALFGYLSAEQQPVNYVFFSASVTRLLDPTKAGVLPPPEGIRWGCTQSLAQCGTHWQHKAHAWQQIQRLLDDKAV